MPEWSDLWWSSITGPRSMCRAVARSLSQRGNVCVIVPDDLPWRNDMRACIEKEMRQFPDMESFYMEFIDVEDECGSISDIGRYLLERYAQPAIAAGYRQRSRIQQYLLTNQVLDGRILWLKGMNPEQEKKWLQFCRDYYPEQEMDGRFVLETRWTREVDERRSLTVIRFNSFIRHYDLSLFNSIYLNAECRVVNPIWQQYIAVLCALLCHTDAETSQALMERCDFSVKDPIEAVRVISQEGIYQRRGESNSKHVFSLVRSGQLTEAKKLVWKAQLQTLFPLIEIERVSFVEHYYQQIQEAIRKKYYDYRTGRSLQIYQFGEPLEEADDAELGTLYRMTKLRQDDSSQYLLYIPDEKARERIELLHDIRNLLAHGKSCTIEKVASFINQYPFVWP